MGAALLAAFHQGEGFDPVEDRRISVALLLGAAIGGLGLAGEGAQRHARLFAEVGGVIDGTVTASNELQGFYRGRHVTLRLCPATASPASVMGTYTLCLELPPGGSDWSLTQVQPAVERRRRNPALNAEWGVAKVAYRSRRGRLVYSVAVVDGLVDRITADQLAAQLDLLTSLAGVKCAVPGGAGSDRLRRPLHRGRHRRRSR